MNKIEVKSPRKNFRFNVSIERFVFLQRELEDLSNQIEQRKERLLQLMHQRQDLDEMIDRFQVWFDDKQRYMASDSTIPLKTNEIGRVQKKISVRRKFSIFSASKIFFLFSGFSRRIKIATIDAERDFSTERTSQTRLQSRRKFAFRFSRRRFVERKIRRKEKIGRFSFRFRRFEPEIESTREKHSQSTTTIERRHRTTTTVRSTSFETSRLDSNDRTTNQRSGDDRSSTTDAHSQREISTDSSSTRHQTETKDFFFYVEPILF